MNSNSTQEGDREERPTTPGSLEDCRVQLSDLVADWWRKSYCIREIYVNDIAAGALIAVPDHMDPKEAVEKVSNGLRHLLQALWSYDLVRPVIGVFWYDNTDKENGNPSPRDALARLTWDQEQHRGDFSLREANSEEDAERLLASLLLDTMSSLDKAALESVVDTRAVREALNTERESLQDEQGAGVEPSRRLVERLLNTLEAAQERGIEPDLERTLTEWIRDEGVLS